MEKVCADWPAKAFDEQLVSGKYWDEFAENTKAAATELVHAGRAHSYNSAAIHEISARGIERGIIVHLRTVNCDSAAVYY